jgi:hypothetical protein
MAKLLLHAPTLAAIRRDKPLAEIRAVWRIATIEFQERRERFLLYP